MFGLGMPEIIVILLVALIIFGPDKLPEMARGIGKGIQEFKNLTMGVERQMKDEFEAIIKDGEEPPKAPTESADVGAKDETVPATDTAKEAISETEEKESNKETPASVEPEEKAN